jgi:hypothetical protein
VDNRKKADFGSDKEYLIGNKKDTIEMVKYLIGKMKDSIGKTKDSSKKSRVDKEARDKERKFLADGCVSDWRREFLSKTRTQEQGSNGP